MTEVTLTEDNGTVRFEGNITPDYGAAASPTFTGTVTADNLTATGDVELGTDGTSTLGFYGGGPDTQQEITGALSTVIDAPAKAVLTSIIAALVATGLVTDGTT